MQRLRGQSSTAPVILLGPREAEALEQARHVERGAVAGRGGVAEEAAHVAAELHVALRKLLAVVHHAHVVGDGGRVLGVVPDVLQGRREAVNGLPECLADCKDRGSRKESAAEEEVVSMRPDAFLRSPDTSVWILQLIEKFVSRSRNRWPCLSPTRGEMIERASKGRWGASV